MFELRHKGSRRLRQTRIVLWRHLLHNDILTYELKDARHCTGVSDILLLYKCT